MKESVSVEDFQLLLSSVCAQDTAAGGGTGWTTENPTFGHCAVASLIVQDVFGGNLLRVSLEGTQFSKAGSHYFNRLPDGRVIDVTLDQFGGRLPADLPAHERTREYLLSSPDTSARYRRLWERLADAY